jgi:hypothetical protein
MTQAQIIAAITAALQQQDSNGEYSNVILVMQTILINQLQLMDAAHLQIIANALNINTSQS